MTLKVLRDTRIFRSKPLTKRSFWGWLFRRSIAENAVIELTNAIVDAGRPAAVSQSTIEKIHSRYRFNVYNRFPLQIAPMYTAFIRRMFSGLAKTELSQDNVDDIIALQTIFQIPDDTVARLNRKAGVLVYRDALDEALSDFGLSAQEEKELGHLGRQLDLDEATMQSLHDTAVIDLIREKVEDALEDGELSPEEEADIDDICKRFNVDLSYKPKTELAIRQAKRLWETKHAPLQPVTVDIQLKRGEECYGEFSALWLEVRRASSVPWHPQYRLIDNSSEIALSYAPIVEDCLTEIDSGQLFLTNKRLIFVGKGTTTTIPYSKILRIEQFREGIKVHKETGRSPYLVSNKALPLSVLAMRLLADA